MQLRQHPILFKIAKFFFTLTKPLLLFAKKYYDQYKNLLPDHPYNAWATQNEEVCFVDSELGYKPLISIVVPLFNTPTHHFLKMVYSVVNQHYDNWELILANASSDQNSRREAAHTAQIDSRIKVVEVEKNEGISANTNIAIGHSRGDYIAFLDHDYVLHPCALHSVVESLQTEAKPELIYSDEDKITSVDDFYFAPFFKPDWSPDLMENVNYLSHLVVIRADLVRKIGGLRPAFDGAQDYDFLLRLIDKFQPTIRHIPRVLYHWRAAQSSTAQDISHKPYVFSAGQRAIAQHLKRIKVDASVKPIKGKPGFYKLTYAPVKFTIILGKVSPAKYQACARWLNKLLADIDYQNYHLIVGDWFKKFAGSKDTDDLTKAKITMLPDTVADYWSAAVAKAEHPVAICIKAAALSVTNDALAELAAVAADPRHFAAAPILVGSNKRIIDSGITNLAGFPKQLFEGRLLPEDTYYGSTEWVRNVDDLSTNIVSLRTEVLKKILANGQGNYGNAPTINTYIRNKNDKLNGDGRYVLWAHSPFEFIGLLDTSGSVFATKQLLSLTLDSKTYFDNWVEMDEVKHD